MRWKCWRKRPWLLLFSISFPFFTINQTNLLFLLLPSSFNPRQNQIIDFYFEHLSQRFSSTEEEAEEAKPSTSNGSSSSNPGVVFVGASASFLCAHGGASAVAGPLKLAKADLVFLPVNDNRNLNRAGGGSHWSLLVFDREGGEGGGGSNGAGAGAAEEEESTSVGGGEKKKGASAAAAVVENGKTTSSFPKGKTAAAKPVFRVYDSLGYKNMICAKELSSALEEHLILDEEEEEEEEEGNGTTTNPAADEAEERSRRQRQRRRLDVAASRTRSIAPTRVLNFVQGRCPRQGNASDCGIYILGKKKKKVFEKFRATPPDPKEKSKTSQPSIFLSV